VVGLDENFEVGGFMGPCPGSMGDPSQDINCFLPGTLVSGAFVGGLVADYAGPVWEVETLRGNRLTVTPNHPILTDQGWVAAHSLREGMNLFSYTQNVGSPALMDVDDKDRPALVQDAFEAIRADGRGRSAVLVGLDLHGDAKWTNGKIDVVGINGVLPGDVEPIPADQKVEDGEFVPAGAPGVVVEADGPSDLGLSGVDAPPASLPSGRELPVDASRVLSDGFPLQPFRIGPAARWHTSLGEKSKQGPPPVAAFIGELFEASAGLIAADQVVRVRERQWCGHVYDLQSVDGWIIAQNIVTSNCRCTVIAKVKGVSE
jgi:hypothetical protein